MVYLQRKIKMRFVGGDEYLPKDFQRGKWVPVIGFEIRKREQKSDNYDKVRMVEDIYYVVIDDKGKVVSIASFNCQTMIDDSAEWKTNQAVELMRNLTILGKVLSETLSKKGGEGTSKDHT